jgi:hypothetical protein
MIASCRDSSPLSIVAEPPVLSVRAGIAKHTRSFPSAGRFATIESGDESPHCQSELKNMPGREEGK